MPGAGSGDAVAPSPANPSEAARDGHALEPVRDEAVQVIRQRVAERQRAARRRAPVRAQAAGLVVELGAERPPAVEEVRIDEVQREQPAHARQLDLARQRLAAAEQVLHRDLALHDERLHRREPGAGRERAGRALADLELDVDAVLGAAPAGRDRDGFEVAERHHALPRSLEVGRAEQLALGDLELAADHLVAGLRVAADRDALDQRALAAHDLEVDRDPVVREVQARSRHRARAGEPEVLVVDLERLAVGLDHRAHERRAGPAADQREVLRGGAEQVALEVDRAVGEPRPLLDRDRHHHPRVIARQPEHRRRDLDGGEAVVEVVAGEDREVAVQLVAAERAGVGDERQRAGRAGRHVSAQLVAGDRAVAGEGDVGDRDLGVLVDRELDVDLAAVGRVQRAVDGREREAVREVELGDPVARRADRDLVDDGVALELDGLVNLVELELAVARDQDLVDRGPLDDLEREGVAVADRPDVGEHPELPDRAQVAAQPLRVERLPGPGRDHGPDRVRIDAMVAADLDAFDALCERGARGPQACDDDQPRALHVQLLDAARVTDSAPVS